MTLSIQRITPVLFPVALTLELPTFLEIVFLSFKLSS
uniref:Uncharacterized protein n=1 Tax=Arundo donax TaxID=35708 RepID=A0A0A9EFV0_ARUDO